jgi:hypothetical protein
MVMCRRTDSTPEENCTYWEWDVNDRVVVAMVAAMVVDTAVVKDFGPPARVERIYSWLRRLKA